MVPYKFKKIILKIKTGLLLLPPLIFADFTFAGLKTHKIGGAAKRISPAVHLLVSSAEVLGFNPWASTKGA